MSKSIVANMTTKCNTPTSVKWTFYRKSAIIYIIVNIKVSAEVFPDITETMPILPWDLDEKRAQEVRTQYENRLDNLLGDHIPALVETHREITMQNLEKRLGHIVNREDIRSMYVHDVFHFLKNDGYSKSAEGRIKGFAEVNKLPNIEVFSHVQAADRPQRLSTELAHRALYYASDITQYEVSEHSNERTRIKVTRLADTKLGRIAVVAAKTDGLSLEAGDQIIDVKLRQSGFVKMDESLSEEQITAFRVLGGLSWGSITEDDVRPFRDRVGNVVVEEELYHPTISTLFLARRSKFDS